MPRVYRTHRLKILHSPLTCCAYLISFTDITTITSTIPFNISQKLKRISLKEYHRPLYKLDMGRIPTVYFLCPEPGIRPERLRAIHLNRYSIDPELLHRLSRYLRDFHDCSTRFQAIQQKFKPRVLFRFARIHFDTLSRGVKSSQMNSDVTHRWRLRSNA